MSNEMSWDSRAECDSGREDNEGGGITDVTCVAFDTRVDDAGDANDDNDGSTDTGVSIGTINLKCVVIVDAGVEVKGSVCRTGVALDDESRADGAVDVGFATSDLAADGSTVDNPTNRSDDTFDDIGAMA